MSSCTCHCHSDGAQPQLKPWTYYRARIAALSRDRAADDPELVQARADLAEARAAQGQKR